MSNVKIPITKESEGILKLSYWNFIWHLDLGIGHFFVCSKMLRYAIIVKKFVILAKILLNEIMFFSQSRKGAKK